MKRAALAVPLVLAAAIGAAYLYRGRGAPGEAGAGAAASASAGAVGASSSASSGPSAAAGGPDAAGSSAGGSVDAPPGEAPPGESPGATAPSPSASSAGAAPASAWAAASGRGGSAATTTAAWKPWTTVDVEVSTEDRRPLGGATVYVTIERPPEAAHPSLEVRLDAGGRGSLPLPKLKDTHVSARIVAVDPATARRLDVTQRSHSATTDVGLGARSVPRFRFRMPRDVEHSIQAIDAQGGALAKGRIVLESAPGDESTAWRFTIDLDEGGRAKRRGLPGGPLKFTLRDAAGAVLTTGTVRIDPYKPGVRIALTPMGALAVRALDEEGRPHVAGGAVAVTGGPPGALPPEGIRLPLSAEGTTRSALPAGDYDAALATEGALGPGAPVRDLRAEAARLLGGVEPAPNPVHIAAGRTATADLHVERTGTLEALVTRDGAPVAGALVEARRATLLGEEVAASARTDATGRARLPARGPTRVSASGPGGGRAAHERVVDVSPSETPARVDLALEAAGTLRVRVRAAEGAPAPPSATARGWVWPSDRVSLARRWHASSGGESGGGALVTLPAGAYEVPWEGRLLEVAVRPGATIDVDLTPGVAPGADAGASASGSSDSGGSGAAATPASGAEGATATAASTESPGEAPPGSEAGAPPGSEPAAATPTAGGPSAASRSSDATSGASPGASAGPAAPPPPSRPPSIPPVVSPPLAPSAGAPLPSTRGALVMTGARVRDAYATGRFGVPLESSVLREGPDRLFAVRRVELPAGRARVALGVYGDPRGPEHARHVLYLVVPPGGELHVSLPEPGRGSISVYVACRGKTAAETIVEVIGPSGPLRWSPANDVALWDRLPPGVYRVQAADRVIEDVDLAPGEARDLGWRDVTPVE